MVEWKTIGDISTNVFAGGTPSTKHEEYYDGDIPWIRSGEIDFNTITKAERNITQEGYNNSSAKLIRKGSIVMAMTGATVAKSAIVEFETSANQSVCAIETDESIANYKYVYFYLSKDYFKIRSSAQGALTSLNLAMIKQLAIPIPSLEEQTRIVGILDTFTSAIDNLKEQIAQRRKQYEYYRDQLLDLEGKPGVEMKTIGNIAKYRRGSFPQPYGNKEWYDGEGAMPFVQVADVEEKGMRLKRNTNQFISRLAMPKSVFAPIGTILVTLQGSIGKVAITQYDSYVDRTLGIFESFKIDINKKFFAHQLEKIFSIKKEKARGGTIKTITKEEFTNFIIPLPSIEEQNRIVSILDTFETSIQNLEAQLEQREKQYEYYRNKLLTFQ